MAGLSLAQQIAQLNDTAPPDVDIEQLDGGLGDASGEEENLSAGRDHYLDVGVSSLRRERDALVDPKYEGTRTSRSQLYEFSDASDDAEQDSDEGSGSGHESSNQESTDQEDEERLDRGARTEISEQDREPDASREDPFPPYDNTHESVNNSLAATLKRTREADKTKGQAIVRQRSLWDSVLEARIRMQKTVANGNRLPHPDHLAPYVTSDDGQIAVQLLLKEALALSEDLFTLRSRLLRINEPEADVPPPKRQKIDTVDTIEEQTRDSTNSATTLDSIYHTSCVRTLQKWSSKIAAATPTPSTRGKSFRGGRAARSTVELIEDALGESATNMGGKAVGRTRVRRTDGARIGTLGGVNGDGSNGVERPEDGVEGDAEVFDDLDFYQSLLRDVIDSRTGTNGVEDWTTKQRLKKAKKVVDTKASKGRKLRYDVHEKLQNFMVPVPAGSWHEEQIDELFGNLLGRGTVVGDNVIIA